MKKWIVIAAAVVLAVALSSWIYFSISELQSIAHVLTYEVGGCVDQFTGEIKRGTPIPSSVEIEVGESSIKLLHHLRYVCCAEIKVDPESIEKTGEQVLVRIRERNIGEMCRCICDYEITIKLSGLKPGTYRIQIIGVEFEDMPVELLWEGLVKI